MRLELTRRSAYAVRATLALASNGPVGPASAPDVPRSEATGDRRPTPVRQPALVPASRLARTCDVPRGFLVQVMADLVRAGIVMAGVGRAGGYRLARPASAVTLLDIVEAVEGDVRSVRCVMSDQACGSTVEPCAVHRAFAGAQASLRADLGATTLLDLIDVAAGRAAEGVGRLAAG